MDREELRSLVNHHQQVVSARRCVEVVIAFYVIACVVVLFIEPVVTIVLLCVSPITLLIFLISYSSVKRQVRKMIANEEVNHPVPNGKSTVKGENALDNPAVAIAASYALGKAVKNRSKKSALARNPNTERYAAARAEQNMASGERISLSKRTCATCIYWCGQRQLISQPGGRGYVQMPKTKARANCSKKNRTISVLESNCKYWNPLG